jgi:hypothetical protein
MVGKVCCCCCCCCFIIFQDGTVCIEPRALQSDKSTRRVTYATFFSSSLCMPLSTCSMMLSGAYTLYSSETLSTESRSTDLIAYLDNTSDCWKQKALQSVRPRAGWRAHLAQLCCQLYMGVHGFSPGDTSLGEAARTSYRFSAAPCCWHRRSRSAAGSLWAALARAMASWEGAALDSTSCSRGVNSLRQSPIFKQRKCRLWISTAYHQVSIITFVSYLNWSQKISPIKGNLVSLTSRI